jgi:hypothetical protein
MYYFRNVSYALYDFNRGEHANHYFKSYDPCLFGDDPLARR